jgi:hypothetical protein
MAKTFQNAAAAEAAKTAEEEASKIVAAGGSEPVITDAIIEGKEADEKSKTEPEKAKRVKLNMSLALSAKEWDFNEEPEFIGTYKGEQIKFPEGYIKKDKDGKEEDKSGQPFAYVFEHDTGDNYSIGMSHLVEKAMNTMVGGTPVKELKSPYLHFIFKGQRTKSNGQKFNDFDIKLLSYEE